MDLQAINWQTLISLVSIAIAAGTLLTSARKSRVEELVKIIDVQRVRIDDLEEENGKLKKRVECLEADKTALTNEKNDLLARLDEKENAIV